MHDERRFGDTGARSGADALMLSQGDALLLIPADAAEPLFLDEPLNQPPGPVEDLGAASELFLDEQDPRIWANNQPALSPSADIHGDLRFVPSLWTRLRAGVSSVIGLSRLATLVVVAGVLTVAGLYWARTLATP